MSEERFMLIFSAICVAFIVLVIPAISYYGCHARWAGTYPTQWGLIVGCRVQVNGKWIPEKNVREL